MDKLLKYPPHVAVSLIILVSSVTTVLLALITVYIKVRIEFIFASLCVAIPLFVLVKYFLFDKGRNNE